MLMLAAYIFMLRVPSEGLPVVILSAAALAAHKLLPGPRGGDRWPTVVCVTGTYVEWFFWRRKNKLTPSSIFRKCWCAESKNTCPVHVLGKFFLSVPERSQPFVGIREVCS